jgi:hypothetical protein
VSNNPSSRVVARIQPSALIFVTLVLVIGALLLASNNIDPNAGRRAQFTVTPVDPFVFSQYVSWKSPDGFVQLEHPNTWQPQTSQTSPLTYVLSPANSNEAFLSIQMRPTSAYLGVASTTTPDELLKRNFANRPQDLPPVTTKTVSVGNFTGTGAHYVERMSDQSTNQPLMVESELWVVALDPTHVLVIQGITETGNWAKMQPIFEHITGSLQIDSAGAVRAMDMAFPATPAAAGAATTVPTQPATPVAAGTAPATAASS